MAIPVKLNVFEGPLDLLLHLIDKNKIDNEFEDVNDFIQWWYYLSNIDDEEEFANCIMSDIEPIMSEEAFRSITDYFSYEENIIIMQELVDREVFC